MRTKTKTWKIGEYAKGGVITAKVIKNKVHIIGKEWDFSTGSGKGSNQSNARPFIERVFETSDSISTYRFLCELTTSYYADQVIGWIELINND